MMVFRKGVHLTLNESWYLKEQKLEVVGKDKYLGLNCSTMLTIGTEDFASLAKKQNNNNKKQTNKKKTTDTIEMLKALRTYMSLMLSVFVCCCCCCFLSCLKLR